MQRLQADFALEGRYRLCERIGAGGMGEVWLVEDQRLHRRLAAKIMHPHSLDEFVVAERFREEALIGARLAHPHIVAVHDFGEEDGLAFLIMEYLPGQTLAQLLRAEGPLPATTARHLLRQVASALGAAHAQGIVHRDVKPANILVMEDGTAKLTDFGIARAQLGRGLTATGEVIGTPHYLSPEQAFGRLATPASDVYSLGVVGHEMLTGVKPFDAETPLATVLAHAHQPPPPLPSSTPVELTRLITDCLAKDARHRPASGAEVVARLEAVDYTPPVSPVDPLELTNPDAPAHPSRSEGPLSPGDGSAAEPPTVDDPPHAIVKPQPGRRPTPLSYAVSVAVFLFFLAVIYLAGR